MDGASCFSGKSVKSSQTRSCCCHGIYFSKCSLNSCALQCPALVSLVWGAPEELRELPQLQEFQWFLPKISYSLWIFTLSQARIICLSAQPQGADLQRLLPTPAMLGFCVGWVKLGIHPPLSLHFATKFTPQHHMGLVVLERGRKKERWLRSGFFLLRKIEIGGQSTSNTAKYWPRNESHSPTFLWCWNSSSGAAQTPQILINHPNPTETL